MLLLALSCLQGRTQFDAALELSGLGGDGLQLTPGNAPTAGFEPWLRMRAMPLRTHHGFSLKRLARRVWDNDGRLRTRADSVHPPTARECSPDRWCASMDAVSTNANTALETMYPPHPLGTGVGLEWAMRRGFPLAVDVSHIHIQREGGVLGDATLRRLFDYDAVAEVHVSHNDGRCDSHRPLMSTSFGLEWARRRLEAGTPTVLECYMHRLPSSQRRHQIELLRG